MFERFTERARMAVVLAQDEARALKHNYIGTEHLLLGLLREQEGLAARVLHSLGVSIDDFRGEVMRIVGEGDAATSGEIPFTPRAKKVMELALRESRALGHNYIGTEHLLLGLAREHEGVAARILRGLDADADRVRNQTMLVLAGPSSRLDRASPYEPKTPPLAPEFGEAIRQAGAEKERALDGKEFERAAIARDRERRLVRTGRAVEAAWEGRPSDEPPPTQSPLTQAVTQAGTNRARGAFLLGATVGLAAGCLGLVAGRLIWR